MKAEMTQRVIDGTIMHEFVGSVIALCCLILVLGVGYREKQRREFNWHDRLLMTFLPLFISYFISTAVGRIYWAYALGAFQ